jgi:hypothetical protein
MPEPRSHSSKEELGADASPVALHSSSAAELKERLEAERGGVAFLVFRNADGAQRIHPLPPERELTVGRSEAADVAVTWDSEASSIHAQLAPVGEGWVVVDDGLSRNGTFVNGERLKGRHLLRNGDSLRFGRTTVVYRSPGLEAVDTTVVSLDHPAASELSPSQRKVLVALCRPFKSSSSYATPASNQQIAAELFLSVDAVKTHMRSLFAKFKVEDLPQNKKRARLAQLAFESGIVSERDL